MRAIFGLGNPGSEYEGTRHNVGFSVVDAVATKLNVRLAPGKGEYLVARVRTIDEVLLVKPLTCMNNSGSAFKEIVEVYGIPLADTLTIVDDFELPLGKLRLRKQGSAGTHNGLASIVWSMQSDQFPRLRCGIGGESKPKDKRKTAGFVLSTFDNNELETVAKLVQRAAAVAVIFAQDSLQNALNFLSIRTQIRNITQDADFLTKSN